MLLGAFVSLASCCGFAQPSVAAFPDQPVRIVVGFPPGGGADIVARIYGEKLGQIWNQPVIIENRAGAAGVIATDYVARADPDGYTLLMDTLGIRSVNPLLYSMKTDPNRDLTPVSEITAVSFLLVVNPALPVHSVEELIALAKRKPNQINYSSSGLGGGPHLAAALFDQMAGVELMHIPFKGSGPSYSALLANQVSVTFDSVLQGLPYVRSGKLRALAVLGKKRSDLLPSVPTMEEAGGKGYDFTNWFGLSAPAGTPKAVIDRLNEAVRQAQADPGLRDRLEKMGAEVTVTTPEQYAALIRAENAKWAKVIEEAGIRAE